MISYVLNLRAVQLRHVLEVLEQQLPIIIRHTPYLVPALVGVETHLHLFEFDVLSLVRQHEVEGGDLVVQELLLEAHLLHVVLEPAPLGSILELEELLLLIIEGSVGTGVGLHGLLSVREEVPEAPRLIQVVLQVLRETSLEHVSELLDVDAGGGHDLGQVLIHQGLRGAVDLHLQLRHLLGKPLHLLDGGKEVGSLDRELLADVDHGALQDLEGVHIVVHRPAELLALPVLLQEHLCTPVKSCQLSEGPSLDLFLLLLHVLLLLGEELQVLL